MVNDIITPITFNFPEMYYNKGIKYILDHFEQTESGYEAIYKEDPSKGELTANEAWKIIESSNISKENKSKLREFIERVI